MYMIADYCTRMRTCAYAHCMIVFKRASSCQVKLQECHSSNWEDSRSGEEAWAATNHEDQKEIQATDSQHHGFLVTKSKGCFLGSSLHLNLSSESHWRLTVKGAARGALSDLSICRLTAPVEMESLSEPGPDIESSWPSTQTLNCSLVHSRNSMKSFTSNPTLPLCKILAAAKLLHTPLSHSPALRKL